MTLPFPAGWYVPAFSHEIAPGELRSMTLCGREVVLFRAERSHQISVLDAHCPHLGAHFGHGGRVEGDALRCPFHGLRFDASGTCVSTPYQGRVPPVRARAWPTRERDGVVLAWFDPEGADPGWEVPVLEASDRAFGRLHTRLFGDLKSHPQETTENSVDLGHFAEVHGFQNVVTLSPLRTAGHYLTARYAMDRPNPFVPVLAPIRVEFEVHAYGLGYSVVDAVIAEQRIHTRHFVFSTPTTPGRVDLRVAMRMHLEAPRFVSPALRLLPRAAACELVERLAMRAYLDEIARDFDIWEHKILVQPPRLAEGDGPIGPYRRWCRQFYRAPGPSDGHPGPLERRADGTRALDLQPEGPAGCAGAAGSTRVGRSAV